MEPYDWDQQRRKTIIAFGGEQPKDETEREIVAVFARAPLSVIEQIDEVAADKAQGKARSGWAVLLSRLRRQNTQPTVVAVPEKARLVANAERWIRNAGIHIDDPAEVEDELFGDRGRLRAFASDNTLRTEMVNLWREQRPRGEAVEQAALDRAQQWKQTQTILKASRNEPARD